MVQSGTPNSITGLSCNINTTLASGQVPPITATTLRQDLLDMAISNNPVCDPWSPPTTALAKGKRTILYDWTFGSAATTISTFAPITNTTQLSSWFWYLLPATVPNSATNGTLNRYHSEWQSFSSTPTHHIFNTTDLQMECRITAAVPSNTSLTHLRQNPTTANTISSLGSYTFTISSGLDWGVGERVNIAGGAGGGFSDAAFGSGLITAYNAGTGAVTLNVDDLPFPATATGGSSASPWALTRALMSAGMIRTKQTFLYGFIEGMIWTPPGAGFIPQFWLFPDDASANGTTLSEIDIFEQVCGNRDRGLDGTFSWCAGADQELNVDFSNVYVPYFDLRNATQMNGGNFAHGPLLWRHPSFDVTTGFHKYQALWVPGYVFYYIDDFCFAVLSQAWRTKQGINSGVAQIFLNFAVGISGANFAGTPDNITDFPAKLRCQYIRVWQSEEDRALSTYLQSFGAFNLFLGGVGMTSSWIISNTPSATFTTGVATDSNGGNQAARLTEGAGSSFWNVEQAPTIAAGSTYTLSVKIHAGSGTRNALVLFSNVGFTNELWAFFSPVTGVLQGTVVVGGATLIATGSNALGGGWFQVWVTGSLPSSDTQIQSVLGIATGNTIASTFYDPATNGGTANILLFDPHLILGTSP